MATPAEIQAEIDDIEALLSSGATEIDSDGERIKIDHDALRRRVRELKSSLPGKRHVAQRVRGIDLRNAF